MSDGPHRSLPMRRGWKHVAERGDKPAFTTEDIAEAIVPALDGDCRAEVRPEFLQALTETFCEQDSQLFPVQIESRLASMADEAQCGLERSILENARYNSEHGATGVDALQSAAVSALTDRGMRGLLQVEEHYCRKSNQSRAQRVRERIQAGLGFADIKGFVRTLLRLDPRPIFRSPAKHDGLDEGVRL